MPRALLVTAGLVAAAFALVWGYGSLNEESGPPVALQFDATTSTHLDVDDDDRRTLSLPHR